jgi:bifunctional ADP-heptose synthase (sugar kinase/adenylyltransferase)
VTIENKFANLNLLVVGDVMLDEYVYGDVNRISPEAPVPVVEGVDMEYRAGGAANAAVMAAALGANVTVLGVIGQDDAGARLKKCLTEVAGEQVRKGDFVRVRTEDADVAREIVKSVQPHYPTRIDVETVEIEGTAPRLAVHAKDQHSEVLRRYIEYQGLGEVPGLVELGVEILEEARHG